MEFLKRLWRAVRLFATDEEDDSSVALEDAERDLAALRSVAALSAAQAQRVELELREALDDASIPRATLDALVAQLVQLRARARNDVAAYRAHQRAMTDALQRLGEARRAAELGKQREELRTLVARSEAAADEDALQRIEDEVLAEAARLDILTALQAGDLTVLHRPAPPSAGDVREQARRLLEEDTFGDLLAGDR